MKLDKVLVFSEVVSALPALCSGANSLAEQSIAVVLGSEEDARGVAQYAAQVIWAGPRAENSMSEDYVTSLAELIRAQSPDLVLIHSTRRGKCIAGRLGVRLKTCVCSDVGAFEVADAHSVRFTRMVYGGAAFAEIRSITDCPIALVGGGVFEAQPLSKAGEVSELPLSPVSNGVVRTCLKKKQEPGVDLGVAKRVVSVGRGVGSQDNISIIEALAKATGGELACSRPVAEGEHWMPKNRYVGVSGAVIKPDVYIACGISGQVQHMVGVNDARVIIAINKDKSAPIFKNCDYGIVGDLNKIVPALTARL